MKRLFQVERCTEFFMGESGFGTWHLEASNLVGQEGKRRKSEREGAGEKGWIEPAAAITRHRFETNAIQEDKDILFASVKEISHIGTAHSTGALRKEILAVSEAFHIKIALEKQSALVFYR